MRLTDREADVYEVTLDPGATVTFVAELNGDTLPDLYMWKPDAYRDYVNSFTLFRGVVMGVAALAAVFLTIMFVVRGPRHLPGDRRVLLGRADLSAHRFRRASGRLLGVGNGVTAAVPRRLRGGHRHDSVRASCSSISTSTAGICASSRWRWR